MRKFAVLCMLVGLLTTTGALPVTAATLTVQVNAYANINPDPNAPADDIETAWTNTGLMLSAGLPVAITGSGTANRGTGDTGPDGLAGSFCPDYCAGPGLPVASLIGRIGAGRPFLVGVGPTTVTGVGTLYLAFNDGWYQDNRGFFTATIASNQPPQVAVTGVADDSTYEIGHVPAAACSVVNAEDGTKSVSPQLSAITGTLSADGLGSQTATCSYTDGGGLTRGASATYTIADTHAPAITDRGATAGANANGWYKSAVTNTFRATDTFDGQPGAGFSGHTNPYDFTKSSGTDEGTTVTIASGSVSDVAGNAAGSITSAAFKIDLHAPTGVAFAGGIAEGQQFYFGDTPATPTCTATDALSGLDTCVVTGYGTAVGSQTLKATATDKAGNQATLELHYTVKVWTFAGFFQPVDMGGAVNTVKSGATVPLKFTVAKGGTLLTDPAAVVQPIKAVSTACGASVPTDDIELVATGGTVLRYDAAAGQFVYNWQTPSGKAGTCWSVTISAQDGSSQTALFQLK